MRVRVALLSTLTILAVFGVNFAIIIGSRFTSLGSTTATASPSYVYWEVILSAEAFLIAFIALVVIGFVDKERDLFYWPFTILIGLLAVYLVNAALSSTDVLLHNHHPQWNVLSQPEIRPYLNGIFVAMGLAVLWISSVLLFGRWGSKRRVAGFYLAIVGATAVGGVILVVLAHRGLI